MNIGAHVHAEPSKISQWLREKHEQLKIKLSMEDYMALQCRAAQKLPVKFLSALTNRTIHPTKDQMAMTFISFKGSWAFRQIFKHD